MKNHPENNSSETPEKSAPLLFNLNSGMDSNGGFRVPEGYFDSLSSEVLKTIELLDFKSEKSSNPFQSPEGYFEALPATIQHRIGEQEKNKNVLLSRISEIFKAPAPKYSLAFVSIFLIIFFSIKYFTRTVKVEYVNSQPETEQLESFYLSQLDETVLVDAYTEEKVTANESQENAIENYLMDNNIDLSLISEHL